MKNLDKVGEYRSLKYNSYIDSIIFYRIVLKMIDPIVDDVWSIKYIIETNIWTNKTRYIK